MPQEKTLEALVPDRLKPLTTLGVAGVTGLVRND